MPKLVIDNREVEVPAGATILDAARKLGVGIPTLCHLDGCTPSTSCMVCVVKLKNLGRVVPSCGTRAEDGMQIESETDEIRDARRAALELLLSDHPGDCLGPCQLVCPAHMDIPRMLRQIAAGRPADAAATARDALVLPATLGRICPAPCEKGCRRAQHDVGLAIRLCHRHVADAELAAGVPLPTCKPATGKRVALIGAGPAGLAAAWHLLCEGHACTVFDAHPEPGGMLRYSIPAETLPRNVLDAEIAAIARLGAEFRMGMRIGRDIHLADLQKEFDAVLVASGAPKDGHAATISPEPSPPPIEVDRRTWQTSVPGLFAGGEVVHKHRMAVRAVADGGAAARSVSLYLAGRPITEPQRPFSTRLYMTTHEEMARLVAGAGAAMRIDPTGGEAAGFTPDEARREAPRCLHCDCRKADVCRLRQVSAALGASPSRYHGTRRPFEQDVRHPRIVYEPGKCIVCGLCLQVAERAGEPLGLALLGRGFNVRVGAPLADSIADGLRISAAECVRACPTGALAFKDE